MLRKVVHTFQSHRKSHAHPMRAARRRAVTSALITVISALETAPLSQRLSSASQLRSTLLGARMRALLA